MIVTTVNRLFCVDGVLSPQPFRLTFEVLIDILSILRVRTLDFPVIQLEFFSNKFLGLRGGDTGIYVAANLNCYVMFE